MASSAPFWAGAADAAAEPDSGRVMPILSAFPAPPVPPHAVTTMAAAATAAPTRTNFMNSSSNFPR